MKLRSFHKLAILLPVLIIMLHSFTPHVHGQEVVEKNLESSYLPIGIFGWLSHCFEHDLGEGHLENFTMAKKVLSEFDLSLPDMPVVQLALLDALCIPSSAAGFLEFPFESKEKQRDLFSSDIKRAPPEKV